MTTADTFTALYTAQLPRVRAIAARWVCGGDRDLVEDLVQEAFLRLWIYMERGAAIGNPGALLGTLTRRAAADHYRLARNARERAADFSDPCEAAVYRLPASPSAEDLAVLHLELEQLLTDAAARVEVA